MEKREALKKARITFWLQAVMTIGIITLFETGIIARNTINLTPTMQYASEVASALLTITLIPLAIKGFSTLMRRAAEKSTPHFNEYFYNKSNAQLSILFVVTIMNITLYYGNGNNSAFYCALLGMAATIYSYPTAGILDNRNQENNRG